MHSALTLTAYLDNPPADPNTDALFAYISTRNVRDRLKEQWSGRGYAGYSTGMSPICIPVSAIAAAMPEGEKNALLVAARLLKAEYNVQASYAIATASVALVEFSTAAAKSGQRYARGHVFYYDRLRPALRPAPRPSVAPSFFGDGICEKYVNREHRDKDKNVVLDLDTMFLAANTMDNGLSVVLRLRCYFRLADEFPIAVSFVLSHGGTS